MKKRNYKIDNIKFILIFLVVLGHSLYSYKGPNSKIATDIVYFIYSFHMPIFCFISGMMTKKELNKEQIFKLFGLFVIMNTSFYIYDFIKSGNVALPLFKYSSWYLFYLLLYRWLYSKIKKKKVWMLLAALTGLLIGFIPYEDNVIFIYRGIYYLAFFMLGGLWEFKNIDMIIKVLKDKKVGISIVSIILIILTIYVIHTNNFTLNYFTISYYRNMMEFIYRILFLISSLFIIMCLLIYVPDKKWLFFNRMGEMSLSIYFFHRIFTLIFSDYFVENDYFIIMSIIFSILLCFIFSSKIFEIIIKGIVKVISNKIAFIILTVWLLLLFFLVELDTTFLKINNVVTNYYVDSLHPNSSLGVELYSRSVLH